MTPGQARDEMFAMLRTYWNSNAPAVVASAYTPALYWQGQEPATVLAGDKAHARVTLLTSTGRQASLAGASGTKIWDRGGVVITQCFAPIANGKALEIAESLGYVAVNAFEGKTTPSGAWFRNVRLNEIGPKDGWFAVNAIADFSYNEVK